MRIRIDSACSAKPTDAPILYMEGALGRLKETDDVKQLFTGGRATVSFGYIGLYEVNTVFYGSNWEQNPEAVEFSKKIVQYIHDKCMEWFKEEDFYYSLYSTPSESLTDRFNRLDTEKFGIVKDITDKDYYNNSFHFDIRKSVSPFEKMEFEAPYQHIATGGHISYNELQSVVNNLDALEAVWDYSSEIGIDYLGTNVPIDTCLTCDYHGQCLKTKTGWKCPNCGEENDENLQIVQRLCGYLGEVNTRPVVHGRMEEIEHRVHHNSSKLGITEQGDNHVIKQI